MAEPERYDAVVLGSGEGGKYLAWHLAQSGQRVAVVERRWIGGSCPNINCLPSKNEIWSARVAHLVHHAARFGTITGPVAVDVAVVRQRKRQMVEDQIAAHLRLYEESGAELIMGSGRFVAPKTLEVRLNEGGTRLLAGERVFLNVGTHPAIPSIAGLQEARPLTNIEALELDYQPRHLIVLGGGYVGLELGQASTSWSRRGARRIRPGSGSRRPASSWTLAATSVSTSGWSRARPASGRSGSAPGAPSSPTSPSTTSGSSGTTWRAGAAAPGTGWSPTACSPTRRSRTSA